MSENFNRRRPDVVPEIVRYKRYRDISVEYLHKGAETMERYVKCDGESHIIEVEIITFDAYRNPVYGSVQKIGEPAPCTCTEEAKTSGDSVWSKF